MPKTVLLADDSVTIQHAVGISLANEDIALVNVGNGEDAVIRARAIKPDLILLDVVMPKVSGYEACRQIRQDPSIKHTPVIMLVGAIEGFDEQKFRESMANDYIIKPFESGALINKIRKYLYPELSRVVPAPQPAAVPPVAVSAPVIPPVVPPATASSVTNPQIPIPPKPAVPPVVPPVIPSAAPVMPPVPPMPPHIQPPPVAAPQVPQPARTSSVIPSFTENLIPPVSEQIKKEEPQDTVDEISPQEIEEITSDIPELQQKQETAPAVSVQVPDIVSQVEQTVKGLELTPDKTSDKPVEEKPFDMEEWGKDLKKEIMEASGVSAPVTPPEPVSETVQVKEPEVPPEAVQITLPPETQPPMQVVSIAESISTEPVGEPAKPVDIPAVDIHAPAEVEPTSLVEKKIDLCSPLSEETVRQVREIVERVVWEIVPELAEKLIKEEIKRLMSEKEE